jgi:hypothetical protein
MYRDIISRERQPIVQAWAVCLLTFCSATLRIISDHTFATRAAASEFGAVERIHNDQN